MPSQIRNTEVSLKGLLDVLGENLYSTPIVSIRELIQNAHDACVRRRIEANWQEKPRVYIETDSARSIISISDNGSGLTEHEIISYLATIGDGYTRKMRNNDNNEDAIGYFGLGFLSVFVVAKKVEFITTSYQEENTAWHYSSKDGQRYSLKSTTPQEVGSTVILHLKDDYSILADAEFITSIVKKYCCLLDIDIFINQNKEPDNRIEIPWRLAAESPLVRQQKAGLHFASLFDRDFDPIVTIPIMPTDDCPVHGLIWIQDGSFYVNSDNRTTTIFIRSMHITDDAKELLPVWAGFMGCVIDTPLLTPTASRETVQSNTAFETVQAHIKHTLINALSDIAHEKGANWRRMMTKHNDSLIGAAVSDETLFDAMHQQLTLPTTEGELMMSEILDRNLNNSSNNSNNQINHSKNKLYLTMDMNNSHETVIFKSLGIPIIHGFRYAVGAFCKRLKQKHDIETRVIGTNESNSDIFPEVNVDESLKQSLLEHFDDDNSQIIISAFEPDCLPLIITQDQDALLKKRIESDKIDKRIGGAALMMARQFTETMDVDCDQYLFINTRNSLIGHFNQYEPEKQIALAHIIKNIALLLSGNDKNDNYELFETLNTHLTQLSA